MRKNLINCIGVFFCLYQTVFGQVNEKVIQKEDFQWFQYYNQTKLSEKWTWLSDASYRWWDGFSEKSQFLVRTGIGYNLNKTVKINTGFALSGFYKDETISRIEYRPYEDFILTEKLGKINIQHRLRLEQRFFKNVVDGKVQAETAFNHRFRYLLNFTIPLTKLSKKQNAPLLSLNVSDEIFINAGKEIVYNIFDQNRTVLGPMLQLNQNLTLAAIYNGQFAATNRPANYRYDQIFWIQIRHNGDFSKQNKEQ